MKEPLYRKVNTKTHCHHWFGSDAKWTRNTKNGMSRSMKKDVQRGLDYTPLYRFLLSKVGQPWDQIYSEAVSRLDKPDPIWWMVQQFELDNKETFKDENARFSRLKVSEEGLLEFINPNLKNEDFAPSCPCCTYTFNGKTLVKKYNFEREKNLKP